MVDEVKIAALNAAVQLCSAIIAEKPSVVNNGEWEGVIRCAADFEAYLRGLISFTRETRDA